MLFCFVLYLIYIYATTRSTSSAKVKVIIESPKRASHVFHLLFRLRGQNYAKSFFLPREMPTFFTKYCKISIIKWKKAKTDRTNNAIRHEARGQARNLFSNFPLTFPSAVERCLSVDHYNGLFVTAGDI
jgi:hypothetical protein